jgi:hypothetical protein
VASVGLPQFSPASFFWAYPLIALRPAALILIRTTSMVLPSARPLESVWVASPSLNQTSNHVCAEAERCERRLRHAITARGREHDESPALFDAETRTRHCRAPPSNLSARSLQIGIAVAPSLPHRLHRCAGQMKAPERYRGDFVPKVGGVVLRWMQMRLVLRWRCHSFW